MLRDVARNKKNIVHHMTVLLLVTLYGDTWQAKQGHVELYLYLYDTVIYYHLL